MAAFSRRMLKLIVVAGTVPAVGIGVGYRMRSVQAAEGANSGGERKIYKACELPIYPSSGSEPECCNLTSNELYPRNVVEEQIGLVRKSTQDFLSQFQDYFDMIRTTAETGIEHSVSSLDYIQNNPGELPRVVFIVLAGMGGIVLGYRGGIFKKLTYGSLAGVAAASLCYPKKTVELSREGAQSIKDLYLEIIGESTPEKFWPFKGQSQVVWYGELLNLQIEGSKDDKTTQDKPVGESQAKDKKSQQRIKGDPGQSNPGDKDLYGTRSS